MSWFGSLMSRRVFLFKNLHKRQNGLSFGLFFWTKRHDVTSKMQKRQSSTCHALAHWGKIEQKDKPWHWKRGQKTNRDIENAKKTRRDMSCFGSLRINWTKRQSVTLKKRPKDKPWHRKCKKDRTRHVMLWLTENKKTNRDIENAKKTNHDM